MEDSSGPGDAVEWFAAIGGVRGFPSASGSPDTSSDGRGDGRSWAGCVFPGRGYRFGWGRCLTCLWKALLTFIRTDRRRVPLHGCWIVCGVDSTAWRRMIKNLVVRTLVPHMGSNYTTRGCWSTWMRRSRLDYLAAVRNIGCTTWNMRRRLRLRSSFSTTWDSSYQIYRWCSRLWPRSTGRRQRSCGSPSVARRFRPMPCRPCSRWCRLTGFVGWLIMWWLWACGGRQVLQEFGDPCRQRHAMPACRAVTVSQTCRRDSVGQYGTDLMCERHVAVRDYICVAVVELLYWSAYILCLHSIGYMCVLGSVFGLFSCTVLFGSS